MAAVDEGRRLFRAEDIRRAPQQELTYDNGTIDNTCRCDGMVDVVDSKSTASDGVPVRVRPPAPKQYNPNQLFPVGKGFGFIVYFTRYDQTYFANGWKIRPESKPRGPKKKKQR